MEEEIKQYLRHKYQWKGHMVFASDENENIYGVYDNEILLYGRNYNNLMNLLYHNEDKGKLFATNT